MVGLDSDSDQLDLARFRHRQVPVAKRIEMIGDRPRRRGEQLFARVGRKQETGQVRPSGLSGVDGESDRCRLRHDLTVLAQRLDVQKDSLANPIRDKVARRPNSRAAWKIWHICAPPSFPMLDYSNIFHRLHP